jgi:hypothetical protein
MTCLARPANSSRLVGSLEILFVRDSQKFRIVERFHEGLSQILTRSAGTLVVP